MDVQINSERLNIHLSFNEKTQVCDFKIFSNNAVIIRKSVEKINKIYDETPFNDFLKYMMNYTDEVTFRSLSPVILAPAGYNFLNMLGDKSDVCVGEFSFTRDKIEDIGSIEKDLLIFDMRYNTGITAITLMICEAVALIRKALKWGDQWGVYFEFD